MTSHTNSSSPNCTSFDTPTCGARPFNNQNRFHNDPCFLSKETQQSTGAGKYRLHNFYACGRQPTQTMDIALSQPLTQFSSANSGKVGQDGCLVDTYSSLRNGTEGNVLTNKRGVQTLYTRPYLTVPYMGRGVGDPCRESEVQEGVSTYERKQCNTLAGIHLPHQYTPLVDCLRTEVQNPIHILPEDNQRDWTRGGYPSRQWVHNQHFDDRCPQTTHCSCPTAPRQVRQPAHPRPMPAA